MNKRTLNKRLDNILGGMEQHKCELMALSSEIEAFMDEQSDSWRDGDKGTTWGYVANECYELAETIDNGVPSATEI